MPHSHGKAEQDGPPIALALAREVTGLSATDLPPAIVAAARDRILDQIGVQLLGSTMPWCEGVIRFGVAHGGEPASTITGANLKVPPQEAAFVNATLGHSCELDDYGAGHAGAATVPAAIALGEALGADGLSVIAGVVAGYEVQARLNDLLHAGLTRRGFHSLTVIGVFGATAAAARLLRLSVAETANAFAIAGSSCGGTMEYDQSGGDSKRLHAGLVARAGVQSAQLAAFGLTGPLTIFEGKRGIGAAFADFDGDWSALTRKLAAPFAIPRTNLKKHPVLARIAASLDIAARLTGETPLAPESIRRIRVAVNAGTLHHGGSIRRPRDMTSAQMSLPYALALQLALGRIGLAELMDDTHRADPRILALADRIELVEAPDATGPRLFSTRLEIELASGETLSGVQDAPEGAAANPFTPAQLAGKFRRTASAALPSGRVERLLGLLEGFETLPDIRAVTALLGADGPIGEPR